MTTFQAQNISLYAKSEKSLPWTTDFINEFYCYVYTHTVNAALHTHTHIQYIDTLMYSSMHTYCTFTVLTVSHVQIKIYSTHIFQSTLASLGSPPPLFSYSLIFLYLKTHICHLLWLIEAFVLKDLGKVLRGSL